MMRYDRASIDRAFKMHAVEGPFRYLGMVDGGAGFKVALCEELLILSPREAWLVGLALADGRRNGLRVGAALVKEEVSEQGASPEWIAARLATAAERRPITVGGR